MMQSKIIACLLCLTILTSAVGAQESQPSNSDRLKKKIESINRIYKRTLLRQYDEYISSLEKDIADLREVMELGGTADEIKKIAVEIERLTEEKLAAAEKVRSLGGDAQEDQAMALPTPSPSPTAAVAQLPYGCPEGKDAKDKPAKESLPAGVIWCKKKEAGKPDVGLLSVQGIAEYAAPILWFSPDEPLRAGDNRIPEPLPGDEISGKPVVYYRVSEVVLEKGATPVPANPDRLNLDEIKGLTLKYYFYYSKDKGFQGHRHDLESVRLDVQFTLRAENGKEKPEADDKDNGERYYVAYISRVIGAAHGVTWYSNQLDIGDAERDTSLPITLLIEEGKHATSPDRNADGFYSPGYDVNKRYTDAWGVRDILGSGQLGGARYEGSMTKPRKPVDMIMVDPTVADPARLLEPYTGEHREALGRLKEADKYRLKRAEIFENNEQRVKRFYDETKDLSVVARLRTKDTILGWMKTEKFGEVENGAYVMMDRKPVPVKPKPTYGDGFLLKALRFGHGIERNEEFRDAIPIAYRLEGRQHGFTILPPVGRYQVFFLDGYFLPKINVMFPSTRTGAIPGRKPDRPVRFSLEAMYTPSASRTFDWYATMGSEWARPDQSLGYAAKFVQEGGLRFRFNQGNWLLGGRFGLRFTGFAEARSPRFIFEFGTGAF